MKDLQSFESNDERYVLLLDVRYGIVFNRLQSRFYSHLLTALGFAQVVAGSAAVVSVVNASPRLAAIAGIAMAVLGAISALVDVGGRAARFDEHSRRYGKLDEAANALTTADLSAQLSSLQNSPPDGEIYALADPAYNANLRANGRTDAVVELTPWERLVATMA